MMPRPLLAPRPMCFVLSAMARRPALARSRVAHDEGSLVRALLRSLLKRLQLRLVHMYM